MRGCLRKEARTLRPNQILLKWHSLQQSNSQLKQAITEKTHELSTGPAQFFEQINRGLNNIHIKGNSLNYSKKTSSQLPNGADRAAKPKPYAHSC